MRIGLGSILIAGLLSFGGMISPLEARDDCRIVAFGDSLTAGLGVEAQEAYPAVLQRRLNALGISCQVVNAGISGETTAGGARRVEWLIRSQPSIVILELGANDGLRGLDLHQTEANLAQILDRLQAEGIRVILAGMRIPTNYGREYTRAFEAIYTQLAARYPVVFVPFFLEGVAADSRLNQADGIHPTARGYEIIVDHLLPYLMGLLPKA